MLELYPTCGRLWKDFCDSEIATGKPELVEEAARDFDRSLLYVTYCDGIGCNASTKGALNLSRLGFQVKELLGGLDWWKRDGYATEGAAARPGRPIVCGCEG